MTIEQVDRSDLLKDSLLGRRLTSGPGGMRTISSTLCFLLIWERFPELGGMECLPRREAVSGSTVPLALWSGGLSAKTIQRLHVGTRYLDHLPYTRKLYDVVTHHWWQLRRFKGMRPSRGLINPAKFAAHLEGLMDKDPQTGAALWPSGFSCVATCEDDATQQEYQVIFTPHGIYLRSEDGKLEKVSNQPPPIGQAVVASCAIPLGFEPVQFTLPDGRTIYCFDGSMTREGAIPMAAFTAVSGDNQHQHIILDVGEEQGWKGYLDTSVYRVLCGDKCIPDRAKVAEFLETANANERENIYVHVNVTGIGVVDFNAGADQKWVATAGCVAPIAEALGLLNKESLAMVRDMVTKLKPILANTQSTAEGELAQRIEAVFVEYGLY